MAATGYTPISLYYSTTASQAPLAANLVNGELGLNITDGKLYYKDNLGVVQVLASKSVAAGNAEAVKNTGAVTTNNSFYLPFIGNNTTSYQALNTSSYLSFNPSTGTLVVGTASALGGTTNPITAFTGNSNNYVQTYIYNANAGASASADFVAYADNSTDTHGWADMGFTSSVYADATYTVTGPNEAYFFGSAPSGSGATGNVVFATDNTGTTNAFQWYVGGFTQAKSAWGMQLTASGLQLAAPLSASYGGTGATSLPAGGLVGASATQTLTNKRINPRVSSTTSSATAVTPDISAYDVYAWTAQAATLTINAPIGTPVDGNKLIFRILDNGTPQTISWNATFTAVGATLPTTTTANKTTYVGCIYNANNTRWDVVAVTTQA